MIYMYTEIQQTLQLHIQCNSVVVTTMTHSHREGLPLTIGEDPLHVLMSDGSQLSDHPRQHRIEVRNNLHHCMCTCSYTYMEMYIHGDVHTCTYIHTYTAHHTYITNVGREGKTQQTVHCTCDWIFHMYNVCICTCTHKWSHIITIHVDCSNSILQQSKCTRNFKSLLVVCTCRDWL